MLQRLAKTHKFISFEDVGRTYNSSSALTILQHDVDSNLQNAVEVARIDTWLNIKSTFFVMVNSPYYNPMTKYNQSHIAEIYKLGHDVGLHYSGKLQDGLITNDIQILQCITNKPVNVVSFHAPGQCIKTNYQNFISSHSPQIIYGFKYTTDSNAVWDYSKLNTENQLQINVHPMWVMNEGSPKEIWKRVITTNTSEQYKMVQQNEKCFF